MKELTSELGTNRKQHTSTRVRMTILERQCKSRLEKAQTRVQQTQTSRSVPSANLELQLQPTPELLRQAIATDGLLSQTRSTGDFDEEGQAGPRGHFRIALLEVKLADTLPEKYSVTMEDAGWNRAERDDGCVISM